MQEEKEYTEKEEKRRGRPRDKGIEFADIRC